jgi:hypothetical protein
MEKLKRTLFFWALVILFLITAPTVVLRARGYRFDFSRGVFVHSGTITIKSNPQTMDVNLNGEIMQSKALSRINNSYNITGLIPKDYSISVSADGWRTWTKKTEVHSGVSSEFWNVLLVRNDYARTLYDSAAIDKFFLSPKDKYAAFDQKIGKGILVKILNLKGNQIENAFSLPEWQLADDSRKENIEWSPEEDYLSVPVQKTTVTEAKTKSKPAAPEERTDYAYFILDPSTGNSFSLNDFLGLPDIRRVRWDPVEKGFLFFISENSLYRANVSKSSDLALITSGISSYELSETNVYYTQSPTQLVYKTSLDGKSDNSQVTNNFPESPAPENDKLIVYDDSRIAFLNSQKEFFIYNKGEHDNYFRKLGDGVEGMQFSNDGKKILYWTNNEISAYFLRDWDVQPVRSENEVQNITRYSQDLKNIQWFKDYEHVIFSANTQIKIIELDARDHRNSMDLPNLNYDSSDVIYNNSLEKLFFTDKESDSGNALYSIVFPEKTGILGF